MRALLVSAVALLLATWAEAQEPVLLRTQVRPEGSVWVGQRVSLYVTVWMAERPEQSPRFDLPEVEGALLRQAPGSPLLGTERKDGATYTTQRFELLFFAQRAGLARVPPVQVRVTLGDTEHSAATAAVELDVRLPEGVAPETSLLTTRELSVTASWDPEREETIVGDAFTRTVTVRAADLLGIVVPPATPPDVAGLAIYPDEPLVDDRLQRGALSCTRTDRTTFVCTEPGTVVVPPLVYTWWNPERRRLERVELEGRTFDIQPDHAIREELDTESVEGASRWERFAGGAALLALGALAWSFRLRLLHAWTAFLERRAAREPAAFRRLRRACRSQDARRIWSELLVWMNQVQASDTSLVVMQVAHVWGGGDLAAEAARLKRCLLSGEPLDGSALLRGLARVRRRRGHDGAALAARQLNPPRS